LPDGCGALDFSMHKRFERAPSNLMIFHSWDTARTAGGGDFTVGVKFGYANENYFILDMYQVQFDYTRHCQTKFYTACLRAGTRWSSTVFAHELPPRSASFEAENGLYLFALTMPL
jgi:hypothetical protein